MGRCGGCRVFKPANSRAAVAVSSHTGKGSVHFQDFFLLFRSNRYTDFGDSVNSLRGQMFVLKTAEVSRNVHCSTFHKGCQFFIRGVKIPI